MKTPDRIQRQRDNHHKALEAIATNGKPGKSLWRALLRIEREASAHAARLCEAHNLTEEQQERIDEQFTERVAKALGTLPAGFMVNHDPRGYALKLDPDQGATIPEGMSRDWGGYGILAPTIN